MPDIRHDQLSDLSSIEVAMQDGQSGCRLCDISEGLILSIKKIGSYFRISKEEDDEWDVKVMRSPNPLFDESFSGEWGEGPFESEPAKGIHELVVLGHSHIQFQALDVQLIAEGLFAAQEDIKLIATKSHITYANLALNSSMGSDRSGHPVFSIIGLTFTPGKIANEMRVFKDEYDNRASCPVCEIVKAEMNGPRQIYCTDNFMLISPWSPARQNELRILPILHSKQFQKLTQHEIDELALILKLAGSAIFKNTGKDYGISFHLNPVKRPSLFYHWYISLFTINDAKDMYMENIGILILDTSRKMAMDLMSKAFRDSFTEYMGISTKKESVSKETNN